MHVTGLTRTALITRAGEVLSGEQAARLCELTERRHAGEPVAYLTGTREFWSLELTVTPDVLVPRPETELLVEQALARIPPDAAWTIADLGTGSGAIARALARAAGSSLPMPRQRRWRSHAAMPGALASGMSSFAKANGSRRSPTSLST